MKKLIIIIGLFLSIVKGNTQTKYLITTQKNFGGSITGSLQIDSATNFRIIFKADAGYRIDSIIVDDTPISKDSLNGYTFYNVVSNHTIRISFFKTTLITIQNGKISPVNIQVKPDTTLRFSYIPDSGYTFDYVIANGVINRDSTTHFTLQNINVDSRLGVYFKPIGTTITVTKKYNGINKVDSVVTTIYPDIQEFTSLVKYTITTLITNGTITSSTTVAPNYNLTITFSTNAGYAIDSIKVGNRIVQIFNVPNRPSNASYTIQNIRGDSIIQVFTSIPKITTSIINGMIMPSTAVAPNSNFTITFNANTGYVIDSIKVGNRIAKVFNVPNRPSNTSYTIQNIRGDSIIQVFTSIAKITTSITNGTITLSTFVAPNSNFTITFSADTGYVIDSIKINGIKISNDKYIGYDSTYGNYTFKNSMADSSIAVYCNIPKTLSLKNLLVNMVTVPDDSFTMGATSKQLQNNGDNYNVWWMPETQRVILSTYKICKYEVTQQLWVDVMGSNPSDIQGDLQRPVEHVSWNDCQTFITRLNQLTGKNYRLPTEAEWEYAARGGNNNDSYIYSGSNNLDSVAWYNGNSPRTVPQTIGTKKANQLGLYDMSGNVSEWCSDVYGNYSSMTVTNPRGPIAGGIRIRRGGSAINRPGDGRVSYRKYYAPGNSDPSQGYIGLRLVL